jgi:hypothetical protein
MVYMKSEQNNYDVVTDQSINQYDEVTGLRVREEEGAYYQQPAKTKKTELNFSLYKSIFGNA